MEKLIWVTLQNILWSPNKVLIGWGGGGNAERWPLSSFPFLKQETGDNRIGTDTEQLVYLIKKKPVKVTEPVNFTQYVYIFILFKNLFAWCPAFTILCILLFIQKSGTKEELGDKEQLLQRL